MELDRNTRQLPPQPWNSVDWGHVLFWGIALTVGVFCWGAAEYAELLARSGTALVLAIISPAIGIRLGRAGLEGMRMFVTGVTIWNGYETSRIFVEYFRDTTYEETLIYLDHIFFGGNPSEWFQAIQLPVLTEYFQTVYMTYFPIMLVVALSLYWERNDRDLNRYMTCMTAAAFATFVGYILVPVRAPYLLTDIEPYSRMLNYSIPMEGLYWTPMFRDAIYGVTQMRFDCFPSGHTMHTIIAMYFGWKGNRYVSFLISILGVSIVISTLYLRYHYAVDLVAGAAIAAVLIWLFKDFSYQPDKKPGGEYER